MHTWRSPILSCIDVWVLPIRQNTEPNMIADAIDILVLTLFVGPSREAWAQWQFLNMNITNLIATINQYKQKNLFSSGQTRHWLRLTM